MSIDRRKRHATVMAAVILVEQAGREPQTAFMAVAVLVARANNYSRQTTGQTTVLRADARAVAQPQTALITMNEAIPDTQSRVSLRLSWRTIHGVDGRRRELSH